MKRGGYFQWQDDTWLLNWAALVDAEAWSWQVDRAEFDEILLRNAADQGAEVVEGATVRRVVFDEDDRPTAVEWAAAGEDLVRTTEFDFLVDASGRTGLLAKHFKMRRAHNGFRNIGIWSYWTGARLHPDSPEGAINVVSTPEGGWFWNIPLASRIIPMYRTGSGGPGTRWSVIRRCSSIRCCPPVCTWPPTADSPRPPPLRPFYVVR